MIAAFRYSLGIRTYMPEFIVDLIIRNHEIFNVEDWKRFVDEINDKEYLGDSCDIKTWNKIINFCEKKIKVLK